MRSLHARASSSHALRWACAAQANAGRGVVAPALDDLAVSEPRAGVLTVRKVRQEPLPNTDAWHRKIFMSFMIHIQQARVQTELAREA